LAGAGAAAGRAIARRAAEFVPILQSREKIPTAIKRNEMIHLGINHLREDKCNIFGESDDTKPHPYVTLVGPSLIPDATASAASS
jgi:hypothetical protein